MRIQLEIDDAGVIVLSDLRAETGVKSHKELFNNAISVLVWAVQQRRQGRIVASIDEQNKNFRELSMPILDRVKVAALAAAAGK